MARANTLYSGPRLAHYPSMPQEGVPLQICARPAALAAMGDLTISIILSCAETIVNALKVSQSKAFFISSPGFFYTTVVLTFSGGALGPVKCRGGEVNKCF